MLLSGKQTHAHNTSYSTATGKHSVQSPPRTPLSRGAPRDREVLRFHVCLCPLLMMMLKCFHESVAWAVWPVNRKNATHQGTPVAWYHVSTFLAFTPTLLWETETPTPGSRTTKRQAGGGCVYRTTMRSSRRRHQDRRRQQQQPMSPIFTAFTHPHRLDARQGTPRPPPPPSP